MKKLNSKFSTASRTHNSLKSLPSESMVEGTNLFEFHNRFQQNLGVLCAVWQDDLTGERQFIRYGNGFAVSPQIVISSANVVYNTRQKKICSSLMFISWIKENEYQSKCKIHKCFPTNFLQFCQKSNEETCLQYPIHKGIVLLFLQDKLKCKQYPMVGCDTTKSIELDKDVYLGGYSSKSNYKCSNIDTQSFQRQDLFGKILSVQNGNIKHDLQAKIGHSGAAILGFNAEGKPVIKGIHTHVGMDTNYGVYLTKQITQQLISLQQKFSIQHPNYKLAIRFPQNITFIVLNQVSNSPTKRRHPCSSLSQICDNEEKQNQSSPRKSSNYGVHQLQRDFLTFAQLYDKHTAESNDQLANILKKLYESIKFIPIKHKKEEQDQHAILFHLCSSRPIEQKPLHDERKIIFLEIINLIRVSQKGRMERFNRLKRDIGYCNPLTFSTQVILDQIQKQSQEYKNQIIAKLDALQREIKRKRFT